MVSGTLSALEDVIKKPPIINLGGDYSEGGVVYALPTDANRSSYSRLNKLVKKSNKSDDNNSALRMADDLEKVARKGQQHKVWKKIDVISGKKKKQSTSVRDRLGQLIADPHAQKERWKEYFSELLNPPPREVDISDLEDVTPQPSF
ncbi:hypothetical protein ACHWQZ_G010287 [Mnemiopsis leidyi]